MATTALNVSVKTRVPEEWKDRLEQIARQDNLDLSDIVRRALSEFMARAKRVKRYNEGSER